MDGQIPDELNANYERIPLIEVSSLSLFNITKYNVDSLLLFIVVCYTVVVVF